MLEFWRETIIDSRIYQLNFLTLLFSSIETIHLISPFFAGKKVHVDALRLDKLHPIVSGNKWFKLKYYLREAQQTGAETIATFGGAYSNHIVATAFAAKELGFSSLGIVRGERPGILSPTLENALSFGMQLHFVSRENYRDKKKIMAGFLGKYWINEGGFGAPGARGIGDIFEKIELDKYSHIITAAGTGTTMAGIIGKAHPAQTVLGISVMKNNFDLKAQMSSLLSPGDRTKKFEILHRFHFGGYAKKTPELLGFMNEIYSELALPLDFVYTAKAFYALISMVKDGTIPKGSNILFVHTGGLQGNLSLPENSLCY